MNETFAYWTIIFCLMSIIGLQSFAAYHPNCTIVEKTHVSN